MRVLVVLDNLRLEYVNKKTNQLDFFNSSVGKKLMTLLHSPKSGLGLSLDEFRLAFAYPRVPDIAPSGKYKPVTVSQGKPYFNNLIEKIIEEKPDLIIPMGNVSLLALVGKKGIDTMRGVPLYKEFVAVNKKGAEESFKTWLFPTYSIESTEVRPFKKRFLTSDFSLIAKFIKQGEKAFEATSGDYELVTDKERLQEIFEFLKTQGQDHDHPIAMDLETNTLNGSYKNVENKNSALARKVYQDFIDVSDTISAKPIILSLSYKEGQGFAIPLDHKQAPWDRETLEYIYSEMRDLVAGERWIVGHNFKFDIRFMMDTIGLDKAVNCIDTLLMYYVGVSEERQVPKGLKTLAYQYTTMGGYEAPLDNYKKDFMFKARQVWMDYFKTHEYQEDGKVINMATKGRYVSPVDEVDGGNFNYEWIPLDICYPYAAGDTDACLRVFHALAKIINSYPKWQDLAYRFYPQLDDALCMMEHNGTKLDMDVAREYHKVYSQEEQRIEDEIRNSVPEIKMYEDYKREKAQQVSSYMKMVKAKDRDNIKVKDNRGGREEEISVSEFINRYKKFRGTKKDPEANIRYNPTSASQNKDILYYMLGYQLPLEKEYFTQTKIDEVGGDLTKLTWQDYKADVKTALPYLAKEEDCTLAKLLIEYSTIRTRHHNFIEKLPELADNEGFIHTRFNPNGTVTSRLSSIDPNMQQLPRPVSDYSDFQYRYSVKNLFTTRFKGGCLLNIDFKSLEIYIAGMLSGDETITQTLLDGEDYHTVTARRAFHIPESDPVPSDVRTKAKATSFGIFYATTAAGLAARLNESADEAQNLIDSVMDTYPTLKAYINSVNEFCKKHYYVETMAGFRRRLESIKSTNKSIANKTLREAFNAVIQGSGAYCTNTALILIQKILRENHLRSKLVLTVHDSVVIDCHPDELPAIAVIAQACFAKLPIKRIVDNDIGNLKVPEQYRLPNNKFRYPLHGEVDIGIHYGDDLEYDPEDFKTFKSIKGYCAYHLELKKAHDKEITYLKSNPEKSEEGKQRQDYLKEHKNEYQQII